MDIQLQDKKQNYKEGQREDNPGVILLESISPDIHINKIMEEVLNLSRNIQTAFE